MPNTSSYVIWLSTARIVAIPQFLQTLDAYRPPNEQEQSGRVLESDAAQGSMGIPMRQIFALAKQFIAMPPGDIETLLESPFHDVRVGAVSIMDWQARSKKTPEQRRKELFELYIRRHDRINNRDLVDRSAPSVVGGYLANKPRDILYELARSKSQWERRTAIVATYYFIRQGDVDDTFAIAELLVHDSEDLVQKAVGGWVREAGKRAPEKLLRFLDTYAATMPRTVLRYAIEHLDQGQRAHYLGLKGKSTSSEG